METLCRDCLHTPAISSKTCPNCAGKRLLNHKDLCKLTIAHIDCDAFYAAIAKRDNPDLKDKPVLIGGGRRGVVSTACYIARLYGAHSAMPMFKALKVCPDAVVVSPDYAKYQVAAAQIREKMRALTPLVQIVSIDEAYLDLSGTSKANKAPPAVVLARLALEIERDVGITVSIGLSENKFLAKTASELDKPRGFAVLSAQEAPAFLAPHAPSYLHGVGPKHAAKLIRDGYRTIGDLQAAPQKELIARYGETGLWLSERAFGRDNRRVSPDGVRKSVSAETTFFSNINDVNELEDELWRLSVKTADRSKAAGVEGAVVTLKLKSADFKTITRRTTLPSPTQLSQTIFRTARTLLAREATGRQFRLIGVGISTLTPAARTDAADLLDPNVKKRASAERAADIARAKFGKDAVKTGRAVRQEHKRATRQAKDDPAKS
jgi:DNA polymerase-4